MLHVGPVLQTDLKLLILKWRIFQFVFNADIVKRYRQIYIEPCQQCFQRILFRSSLVDRLQDNELKTVTLAVNCASYSAIRTLLKLADDDQHQFPLASNILRDFMYVDDALAGAHDVKTTIFFLVSLIPTGT